MTRAAFIALTVVAVALGGCQTIDRAVGSLTGEPSIETPANPQPAQRFLTANDGVAVHAEPNGTSPIVGFLRLKEPVKRTGLESGYAFVSARDGDLEGWVDNGLLTTRQSPPTAARQSAAPAAPAHKHAAAHPSAPEPATSEAETPAGTSSGDGDVPAGETAAPTPPDPHPPLTEVAAETEPAAAALPAARPHPAVPEAEMLNPF